MTFKLRRLPWSLLVGLVGLLLQAGAWAYCPSDLVFGPRPLSLVWDTPEPMEHTRWNRVYWRLPGEELWNLCALLPCWSTGDAVVPGDYYCTGNELVPPGATPGYPLIRCPGLPENTLVEVCVSAGNDFGDSDCTILDENQDSVPDTPCTMRAWPGPPAPYDYGDN